MNLEITLMLLLRVARITKEGKGSPIKCFAACMIRKATTSVIATNKSAKKPGKGVRANLTMVIVDVTSMTPTK